MLAKNTYSKRKPNKGVFVKRVLALTLAVLVAVVTFIVPPEEAHAAVLGDDYKYKGWTSGVDDWRFIKGQCTSFVAWRMNSANKIQFSNVSVNNKSVPYSNRGTYCWNSNGNEYWGVVGSRLANARDWGYQLQSMGYAVDTNPKVGSIAWTDSGKYGHVAWVAEVKSNTVVIEEYNYNYSCAYNKREVNKSSFKYIHVKDLVTNYVLDVNGRLDGSDNGKITNFGTFDILINGKANTGKDDYYNGSAAKGTTWEIRNVKPKEGKAFLGIVQGSRSGTVNGNTNIRLAFKTINADSYIKSNTYTEHTYNGRKYYYFSNGVTWYEAKAICEKLGGHLVTINSKNENDFVQSIIKGQHTWMGGTDRDSEGKWKWVTVEPLSYTNWNSGEPNNMTSGYEGCQNYMMMRGSDGKWDDNEGYHIRPFICEFGNLNFTVKYDANGGNGKMDDLVVEYDKRTYLPPITFTRPCYELTGLIGELKSTGKYWYENSAGNSGWYEIGSQPAGYNFRDFAKSEYLAWTLSEDGASITLHAQWKPIDHTWDSGVIKKKAAIGIEGLKVYTCSVCGATKEEVLPALVPCDEGLSSEWTATKPAGIDPSKLETKTQYRYSDMKRVVSSDPNYADATLLSSEWKQAGSGTINYVNSWPSGFSKSHSLYSQYNNKPKTASETATKKVTVSNTHTGYIYWHWCRNQLTTGPANRFMEYYWTSTYTTFHAFHSTSNAPHTDPKGANGGDVFYFSNGSACKDSYWWVQLPTYKQTWTEYNKEFTYGVYTDWSEWSDSKVDATDTRKVETRALFRYTGNADSAHSWDNGKVVKAATCTVKGEKTFTCTRCGMTKTEAISATGHNYGAWTKRNDDQHQRVCKNDSSHVEKKDHNWDSGKVTKEATEEAIGIMTYTCKVCNGTKTETIPVLEHVHVLKKTAAKAATCTTAGNKAYWTCTSCNKVFSDSAGTKETTKAKMKVAAKGHNYGEWTKLNNAQHQRVCKNDASHVEKQNHTWDKGKVTKKATETSTGVRTYTCAVCNGTKTETIPKLTPTTKTTIRRLYGESRYETALKIADAYKKDAKITKFDSIIVACGTDFPDALSASYLAKLKNAPVVVWRARDNALVQDYIKRNVKSGGRVYLLGGTAVVDNAIKKGLSGYSFTRLQGKTRFETNTAVLKAAKYKGGEILVCDGLSFENALIASATGKPVLLVMGDALRASQIELLSKASKPKFTIVGNTSSVSSALAKELKKYGSVTRITGKTPDEMSAKVAEKYFKNPTEITLAIDSAFPDGLCGGPLSILNKGPLFLVSDKNNTFAIDYCEGLKLKRVNVLGGPTLVSDKLTKTICNIK